MLASLQGDRASPLASAVLRLASPNMRSQQSRCGLRSLFHQEGSKPHLSPHSPTTLLGRCGEVASASLLPLPPIWGKLFHLAAGKHQIQWVSKKEQARLSVLALGEIHLGAGRPEIQLLLQGLFMCFKIKQPMVLVTGIQVSPLPGECPDPRAAESCSLLPSGASGFDFV